MRARLHVRGSTGIGFFREGTHELCDARATRQLLPATCDVLDELARRASRRSATHRSAKSSSRRTSTRPNASSHLDSRAPLDRDDWSRRPPDCASPVSCERSTQAPAGSVLAGDPHVTDVLALDGHRAVDCGGTCWRSFRATASCFAISSRTSSAQVGSGDDVVDLYAGAGLFCRGRGGRAPGAA